ncbi:MAG: Hsp20/alpha crystallin family protein [Gemmatimonadaceae bacterium]
MLSTSPLNAVLDRMVTLGRSMDTAFNPAEPGSAGQRTALWVPDLDASETEHDFVVTLDLPGINAESVDISFERNTLTVSGVREPVKSQNGEVRVFFYERATGPFSRSLRFPQYVEGDKISAQFDKGVLTITVPKAEGAKSRKITIGATAAVSA